MCEVGKKQGSLRKAGPEYGFRCISDDLEVDLVTHGDLNQVAAVLVVWRAVLVDS